MHVSGERNTLRFIFHIIHIIIRFYCCLSSKKMALNTNHCHKPLQSTQSLENTWNNWGELFKDREHAFQPLYIHNQAKNVFIKWTKLEKNHEHSSAQKKKNNIGGNKKIYLYRFACLHNFNVMHLIRVWRLNGIVFKSLIRISSRLLCMFDILFGKRTLVYMEPNLSPIPGVA